MIGVALTGQVIQKIHGRTLRKDVLPQMLNCFIGDIIRFITNWYKTSNHFEVNYIKYTKKEQHENKNMATAIQVQIERQKNKDVHSIVKCV